VPTAADGGRYLKVITVRAGYAGSIDGTSTAPITPLAGTVNITIGFNYGAITISGSNGTNIIYKSGAPNSITLSAAGYENIAWYVDGNSIAAGSGDSITLSASAYDSMKHSITFTGTKSGNLYSQVIPFTVRN
jgi:hypothetical protein